MGYLVTCEHGSNLIPSWLAEDFGGIAAEGRFVSPNGYDVGVRAVSGCFAEQLKCPLVAAKFSPMVVDCNRPESHRYVLSSVTRRLSLSCRERLIREIHREHQSRVRQSIESQIDRYGRVVHLAVHSFAPFEPGATDSNPTLRSHSARRTDLGLLYDPRRSVERELCARWRDDLLEALPMLRVRCNYPIRGTREGLTKSLRKAYSDNYVGIELQLNQAWCSRALPIRRKVLAGIMNTLTKLEASGQSFAA